VADATRIRPPPPGPGVEDASRGAACLVFVEGEAVLGLTVALAEEIVLGRDPACAVTLPSDDVSRRHARVAPEDGGHVVADLGSTNGTWVNGREVERHRLAGGDRIQVGSFVAAYVAQGDAAGRHLEELARLARTDALTGLPNRRALEEELSRAAARAARAGTPLSVLVLDVDRFKQVNDRYGHAAGDAVLAAVASRGAAALRAGDLMARIGGEEFAVLLPGADLERAREAAERVRAAVSAAPIAADGLSLEVTTSLGCAELEAGEAGGRGLLARADAKLYEAKRAGRNRVSS
jgi:two-component system cell cycle response regulator